jgi:hypothetical protein
MHDAKPPCPARLAALGVLISPGSRGARQSMRAEFRMRGEQIRIDGKSAVSRRPGPGRAGRVFISIYKYFL